MLYLGDSGLLIELDFSHGFGESCFWAFFKGFMRSACLLFVSICVYLHVVIFFLFHQFAQQITGMRFCEASAKDNFNVDEIFLKLVDDILRKVKYSGGSSSDHISGQCLNNDCKYLLEEHRG